MKRLNQFLQTNARLRRVALAMLLLMAAALRFPDLEHAPPGLWYDEALNLKDTFEVVETGNYRMVYPDVFPREPMFITILTLPARVFGRNLVAFRMASAMIGVLTVAALYMAVARARGPAAGLLAAGALAGLRWHVIFSRLLFRTLLTPLWGTLVLWAALRAREKPTPARLALMGALMAGGFYTYLSWWFMIPGLVALAWWVCCGAGLRPSSGFMRRLRWPMLGFALTAAPLFIHYARTPGDLLSRPEAVSPLDGGISAAAREVAGNALDALGMFHWRGDHVPKQNIPNRPALDPVQGALFLLGLIGISIAFFRGRALEQEQEQEQEQEREKSGRVGRCQFGLICVAWLMLGIAPTVVTITDSPNFLRTLIATPAVAMLIGLGCEVLIDFGARRGWAPQASALFGAALAALALAGSAVYTNWSVMKIWAPSGAVWESFSGAETQMGRAAARRLDASAATEPGATVWLPALMAEHLSVRFFTDGRAGVRPYANLDFLRPAAAGSGPRYIIVTAHNQVFPLLERWIQGGRVTEELKSPDGRVWAVMFEIPSGASVAENELRRAEASHPVDLRW